MKSQGSFFMQLIISLQRTILRRGTHFGGLLPSAVHIHSMLSTGISLGFGISSKIMSEKMMIPEYFRTSLLSLSMSNTHCGFVPPRPVTSKLLRELPGLNVIGRVHLQSHHEKSILAPVAILAIKHPASDRSSSDIEPDESAARSSLQS